MWQEFTGYLDEPDSYYDIELADHFKVAHCRLRGDMFESDRMGHFAKTLVIKVRKSRDQ